MGERRPRRSTASRYAIIDRDETTPRRRQKRDATIRDETLSEDSPTADTRRSSAVKRDSSQALGPESRAKKRIRKENPEGQTQLNEVFSSEPYAHYLEFVEEMLNMPESEGFHLPVLDLWVESAVPGYLDAIEKPMDLKTLENNIKALEYVCANAEGTLVFDEEACQNDMRLIFRNCMQYNSPGSEFYNSASELLKFVNDHFDKRNAHLVSLRKGAKRSRSQLEKQTELNENEEKKAQRQSKMPAVEQNKNKSRRSSETPISRRLLEKKEAERAAAEEAERIAVQKARKLAAEEEALEAARRDRQRREAKAQYDRERRARIAEEKRRKVQEMAEESAVESDFRAVREPARRARKTREDEDREMDMKRMAARAEAANGKHATASSASSEDQELNGEIMFTFVSTDGLEKKRGRKSATVMELELRHEELMRRRRILVESAIALEHKKQIQLSYEEKVDICERVAVLDFVRMKAVVDIIAKGMNRYDILNQVDIDIDIDKIDNVVLREIQCFLDNPTVSTARGTLRELESEVADIESKLVQIRYNKAN